MKRIRKIAPHILCPNWMFAVFLIVAIGGACPAVTFARDGKRPAGCGACMSAEDTRNGIQSAMTDCDRDEPRRQDALLNTAYRALRKRLSPARFATLRASERQWIKRTHKKCWGDPPRNDGTDGDLAYRSAARAPRRIQTHQWRNSDVMPAPSD